MKASTARLSAVRAVLQRSLPSLLGPERPDNIPHQPTTARGSALVGGQAGRGCENRHESLVDLITSQTVPIKKQKNFGQKTTKQKTQI